MPLLNPTITSKSPGKAREAEHSRDEGAMPFNRMTMQGQVIRDRRRRGKQPNVLEDQKQLISLSITLQKGGETHRQSQEKRSENQEASKDSMRSVSQDCWLLWGAAERSLAGRETYATRG